MGTQYSLRDVYPNLGMYATTTEATNPEPAEVATYERPALAQTGESLARPMGFGEFVRMILFAAVVIVVATVIARV